MAFPVKPYIFSHSAILWVVQMRENIEYLQMLGLTEYQSRAMVVLFAKGEATALTISKLGNIPLTKIYQVLKSLEDKELITCSPGKPRYYRCPGAEEVLNKLLFKKQKAVEVLLAEKDEQLQVIHAIDFSNRSGERIQKIHPILSVEQYELY